VGQLSDSGKSAFTGAHQRPLRPSMHSEPAERAEAGTSGNRQADSTDQQTGDPKPAVKTYGDERRTRRRCAPGSSGEDC